MGSHSSLSSDFITIYYISENLTALVERLNLPNLHILGLDLLPSAWLQNHSDPIELERSKAYLGLEDFL